MTPYPRNPIRSKQRPRRGAVLILTIVCVSVALAILVGLVHIALLRHASQKNHLRSVQAACLIESGLNRAVARLAADPAYKGESWKIPAANFNSGVSGSVDKPALVRIVVKVVADSPNKREIKITADYPDDPILRARRSKQTTVTLAVEKTNTPESTKTEPTKTESKTPEPKAPESTKTEPKTPETKVPEPAKTESKTPETKVPEPAKTESKTPEPKVPKPAKTESITPKPKAPEPAKTEPIKSEPSKQ